MKCLRKAEMKPTSPLVTFKSHKLCEKSGAPNILKHQSFILRQPNLRRNHLISGDGKRNAVLDQFMATEGGNEIDQGRDVQQLLVL